MTIFDRSWYGRVLVERTGSDIAPWTLVAAEDKFHARLKVLETLESSLARVVDPK